MRAVEKVRGGRVYIRPIDQRFSIGDRVTVDEELAAYLCEERGDFERVDGERDGCTVDHDTLEDGEQCSRCDFVAPLPEPDNTDQNSMEALEAQLAADADDKSGASADSEDDASDESASGDEDSDDERVPTYEGEDYDPGEHTVSEIQKHVESTKDRRWLELVRDAEEEGQDRTTALDAIDARLNELEG
ncbi:hypothetical protein [Natrinema salsiterrestre]|uniref:Uncharacterized protein n=1 Tax=Natrinema salsiterrestre TaxID=2950540 RepID=A0A9Q4Q5P6_9EURY|nr:hypothetical protein [Natrinema salsiterrestre]MDF9748368.1 hypothetical protein [Natrinema salsiterrestre]